MKILGDYHIHTRFSDGDSYPEKIALEATEKGLKEFAICDHSYRSYCVGATDKKLKKAIELIAPFDFGKMSIESNILNFDGDIDISPFALKNIDMLSMGFHRFVTKGDGKDRKEFILKNGWTRKFNDEHIKKNTLAYIKAIEKYPIDIICHLGHRVKVNGKKIFECAKSNGCYIELNEKHIFDFEPMIEDAISSNVNFILGSDTHLIFEVGRFDRVEKIIEKYNIPLDRIVGIDKELEIRKK